MLRDLGIQLAVTVIRSSGDKLMLVQGATGGEAPAVRASEAVAEKRAEARMKGYVGEACPECGNFTMVRNGTCLKCDTCGSTTGCS